jgi:hypothetical protein
MKSTRTHKCQACGTTFTAKQAPVSGKCGGCNLKEMGL